MCLASCKYTAPFVPPSPRSEQGRGGPTVVLPESGARRWPVCSAADGVGEVSSSRSRRGETRTLPALLGPSALGGFPEKTPFLHMFVREEEEEGPGKMLGGRHYLQAPSSSVSDERNGHVAARGGRAGGTNAVGATGLRGPPATSPELAAPHPGAHRGHWMDGGLAPH